MTRLFAGTPFDIPPTCDLCGDPVDNCDCTEAEMEAAASEKARREAIRPPQEQKARVRLEKRKGGRKVTVVDGLTAEANDLPDLLARLQTVCGTGGTVKSKENRLELQGSHEPAIRKMLKEIGYRL